MCAAGSSWMFPVFLIMFFWAVPSSESIRCFECNSYENPVCATLTRNDTNSPFYIECPENRTFCRKTVHTIIDRESYTRISRSCGWELHKEAVDNCYEDDDDFKFERSCQCFEDGCNTSWNHLPSFFFVILTVLASRLLPFR